MYENVADETLCWNCRNAGGGCAWSRRFSPVPGWNAVQTWNDDIGLSYVVRECPLFVRDADLAGQKRLSEEDLMRSFTLCEEDEGFRWVRYYKQYA